MSKKKIKTDGKEKRQVSTSYTIKLFNNGDVEVLGPKDFILFNEVLNLGQRIVLEEVKREIQKNLQAEGLSKSGLILPPEKKLKVVQGGMA